MRYLKAKHLTSEGKIRLAEFSFKLRLSHLFHCKLSPILLFKRHDLKKIILYIPL